MANGGARVAGMSPGFVGSIAAATEQWSQPMNVKEQAQQIDIYVGKRLRAARLLAGLSQEKVAEILDLTFQQIQKYENGKNRISAGKALILCRALGVPVGFLFDGAPGNEFREVEIDDPTTELLAMHNGAKIARDIVRLPPPIRTSITNLVAAICS